MDLRVMLGDQVLFEAGDSENVLVPFDEGERAKAFYALTGALAILTGVKPLCSPDAKAAVTGPHYSGTAQYPHGHTDGVVVPLRARPAPQPQAKSRNSVPRCGSVVDNVNLHGSYREVHAPLTDKSYLPLCH